MITQKDWNVFFQQIDDRATESLLDIAHRKEDRNTAVMVDGLLKDSNFMHFFKDIMITEQLTEELPIKEIVISEFLWNLLWNQTI